MPLPHPHGNASGEIGHNSIYDTGVTPGSTGGKFIGFGEEGTSAIANRSHWALSENIDHIYGTIEKDLAAPAGYNRTSPGGGESSFQFPAGEDIWVGDATYPGSAGASDPEGMEMLFGVFDENYNELQDGAGDEVRVKMVRDSTGVTDVYQGGAPFLGSFQSQPILYFMTVDSSGTPVVDPYTIPAATNYKIMCGIKSDLENLPTDALIRFKVQSASEVQAGAFLQDGTRKMTGDFDADSNSIINPDEIVGAAAADLLVRSQQDLTLQGDQELLFKDQYLASPIPLSQTGVASLYQPTSAQYDSVVGALGSQTRVGEALTFNRCLDRTGSFVPASGSSVAYPALKLILGGEYVEIATGSATAFTGGGTYHMYVTPGGTVGLHETGVPPGVPSGSVIIWRGDFDGATVWSNTYDLRWPSDRQGNIVSVYVGDMVGVDFASLDDAAEWMRYGGYVTDTVKPEIVICGTATIGSTMYLGGGWTLRGLSMQGAQDGPAVSKIQTSTTFSPTANVINTSWSCTVKDLLFEWLNSTAHQNTGYGAISGSYNCTFENLKFRGSSYEFGWIMWTGPAGGQGSTIRNCAFDNWIEAAIICGARTNIDNCSFAATSLGNYAIDCRGASYSGDDTFPDVRIRDCVFGGSPTNAYIACTGPNTIIEGCSGDLSGSVAQTCPFVQIESAHVLQARGGATVRNCNVQNGYQFIRHNVNNTTLKAHVVVENNNINAFGAAVFEMNNGGLHNGSSFHIRDNTISDCTSRIGYIRNCHFFSFRGNKIVDHSYYGLEVRDNTKPTIDGNWFEGWGGGNLLSLPSGLPRGSSFTNNYVGPPTFASALCLLIDAPEVNVSGNHFDGGGTNGEVCINVRSADVRIRGNYFTGYTKRYVNVDSVFGGAHYGVVADNTMDGGISIDDGAAIYLTNDPEHWTISGNVIRDLDYCGIMCWHAKDCTISNNTLHNIKVNNPTTFILAVIGAGFNSRAIVITGNQITNFGTTTPATGTTIHAIRVDAPYSIISGNSIREGLGSGHGQTGGTALDSLTGIDANADNIVCTNNFFRYTFGANDPMVAVAGIRALGNYMVLQGNCVWLTGSAPNPGGMFTGAWAFDSTSSYRVACIGNAAFGSWASGGLGGDYSFSWAAEGSIVGNIAENETMDFSNADSIAACNILRGGGSFFISSYPTSTAYNVNTANPEQDFNRLLP